MIIEVLGPEPPCYRCITTLEIAKTVAAELKLENCEIYKLNAYAKSTITKYGLVITPAVAIDGKIVVFGRIPSKDEIKQLLLANIKSKEDAQK
jgi:protein-disulfide isomerase